MWFYEGSPVKSLEDMPSNAFGFIYCITYSDDTKYIGKKNLYNTVKLPALKNGKQRPNSTRIGKNIKGKRVYFDSVNKESNWLDYSGSNDVEDTLEIKHKNILCYAESKRELTYLEVKALFYFHVLEDDTFRNKNIMNKFFKDNLK